MTVTTVFGSTTDGYVRSEDATYATAAAGSGTISVQGGNSELHVGQSVPVGVNRLQTIYLAFDTSGIPDDDIISAVELHLFGKQDSSGTNFDLVAKAFDWSSGGLTTADWQTPTQLSALTTLATLNTSGISASAYNALTSAGAPFNAHINKTGTTYLLVTSSRLISATAPSGDEFVVFHSADVASTTNDPKLVITHDEPPTGTLIAAAGSYAVTGTAATFINSMVLVMVAGAGSYLTDVEGTVLSGPSNRNQRTVLRRVGDPLYEQIIIWSDFDLVRTTDPDQFERLEYVGVSVVESISSHVFRIHFRDLKTTVVTLASGPFATTNGSAVVRVTHTAHGRRTGEYVRFSNTSSVGGIQVNATTGHEYQITYVSDNAYDITHRTSLVMSSNPFAMTNTSAVVRVTDTSHGRSTGNTVFFSDASSAGGIKVAGSYTVTVIDADTYDITHGSAATSGATGGGSSISATYDLYATSTATGGGAAVVATYNEFKIILDATYTLAAAEALALLVAPRLGKLPRLYRQNINRVFIHPGSTAFSAGEAQFTLSADRIAVRIAYNDLEESCLHESTHAAIEEFYQGKGIPYKDHPGWDAARAADVKFLDDYSTTNSSEDIAQAALMSWAMITHPERLPEPDRTLIAAQIPNRIAFFRDVVWIDAVTACVRVPAANVAGKLPTGWTASLVNNTALASHCRDLANLKVEAYYSKASLVAAGIPDLYKFFCNVCGRVHVRPCIGNEPRPFWEVR